RYLLAAGKGVWDDLDAITFGDDAGLDVALARAVAARARIPHRHFRPDQNFLPDWAGYAVWRTDGMLSCLNAGGMDAILACAAESRPILNGLVGDVVLGAVLHPDHLFSPGDPMRAARHVLSRRAPFRESPEEVFKPEVLAQATTRPETTLVEIMRQCRHERLGNVLTSFWLLYRG